jgi:asparagine synthase (glutamine-hydrolysing)
MCGIAGIFNSEKSHHIQEVVLEEMTQKLRHRGPDQTTYYIDGNLGLGFQRLSIMDPSNGEQPFYNEDRSVVLVCNGEIYNFKELRAELIAKKYIFKTNCDVEVLLPLYLEYGIAFVKKLNGQFAIALADKKNESLYLIRDHFGICPLYYTATENGIVFASEIKAILKHPKVKKEVNLTGLDQIFCFPGMVSPASMFKDIISIKPGEYLQVEKGSIKSNIYWDLCYPDSKYEYGSHSENYYIERLEELLLKSVRYRMNADVPIAFYLSGGLDSSLIGAIMKHLQPETHFKSFSIVFPDPEHKEIDEAHYQQIAASHLNSDHIQIPFDWRSIDQRLKDMVYYAECPLKETYNTCSLALSEAVRKKNLKVILSGEGADEFFAGYVGYRFDIQRQQAHKENHLEHMLEWQTRDKLWGDQGFFYEKNYFEFGEMVQSIYSEKVQNRYHAFNSYSSLGIDKSKLEGRTALHKRSYLDLKLRLSDHLISDHCDRTCYANSVEGRYPFLDVELIEFVRLIPPELKLNGLVEKYILKKVAHKYLPERIYNRQKQGFVAPGSPYLLKNNIEWVQDMLSASRIARQGYFDPGTVEALKKLYMKDSFKLNLPFDSDLLIIILTFNIFLELFNMPDF